MLRAATAFAFALAIEFLSAGPIYASGVSTANPPAAKDTDQIGTEVLTPTKHDVSPALASIAPQSEATDPKKPKKEKELKAFPQIATGAADTAVQATVSGAAPSASGSFEGIGEGFAGFTVQYAPPDTNGAVGPNHFVQTVNVSLAVFSKTGALLYGPAAINTLFTGFGGLCATDNDGDPTVIYDQLADRWVIQQFAVTGANGSSVPYLECIAVSKTGDPTGAWNRYSYASSRFPDYPKLGVWPDAYYLSTNDFSGNFFVGASTWAFDRAKMLAGDPSATAQVAHLSSAYGGLLPSSLDGKTQPPGGAPNYFVSLGTSSSLYLWKFHVDFANVANSTVTGPSSIAVAGYTELCNGGTCVPQAGTSQQLDSLADRLMYRLAYRNFADHESLVVTHSVAPTGGGGGVRWYEIRSPGGTPSVYQQSTYAPDAKYRWMASAAMDQAGNIGVGYSVSSSTLNPSISFTGRLATDALNTLQAETLLTQGTGSQLPTLKRWGDYSSMFVDPSDDCTFWYTSEYLVTNGTWNWHTRVGTFKFANCPPGPSPTVTAVVPTSGPTAGGTNVTIGGSNFAAGASVAIGGTAATNVNVLSATQITARTPAHAAGAADVVVTNPDTRSGSCAGCFSYVAPPSVSSVSPASGSKVGGTNVTINGASFQSGATVTFGGAAATNVAFVSATKLTATTPATGTAGAVNVVVTNPDAQTGSCTGCYTYLDAPTVTSVIPNNGPTVGGTNITITGTNFAAGLTTVTVGGTSATNVSVTSSTQVTATTPAGASGPASVVVTVDRQTSNAATFTYVVAAPTASSVSPASGSKLGGTSVTISGANFQSGATVSFGGTAATSVAFVSATQLTAATPAATSPGAVNIVVTNPDTQSGSCAGCYTYLDAPTVTSVNPNNGPTAGGTSITITGTNFASGATVTVGGTGATSVSVTSATSITATTPAHAAGSADVVVTVDRQSSAMTIADVFTYNAGPVISNVQSTANKRNATVTWTTDVPADSQVEYGTTTGYGSFSALDSTLVTAHSVTITSLSRFTTYHYRVYSKNSAGQLTISGDFTFTTG